MKHAREDYDFIQDTTLARQLAEVVMSMNVSTERGLQAHKLARELLDWDDATNTPRVQVITTNGTTRLIPKDEPVFLIRGKDQVGGAAVRAWAALAEQAGAAPDILEKARNHSYLMDAWPTKQVPDLPTTGA